MEQVQTNEAPSEISAPRPRLKDKARWLFEVRK